MRLWIDETEFESDADVRTPDVFVYGGLALELEQERNLLSKIREIKTKYTKSAVYRDMPIKWNMRDVKEVYQGDSAAQGAYESLFSSVKDWRPELFNAIAESKAQLFVAPVEAYSPSPEVIRASRDRCARYGFVNVLQRFSMHAKVGRLEGARIVADWPRDRTVVAEEYKSAFQRGTAADGNRYASGPLCEVGFDDAPMFSITQHSAMLQLADMIVGASRFFLQATLRKQEFGDGLRSLKQVRDNFPGGSKFAHKYSFVPSGTADFRNVVIEAIRHDLYELPKP